MSPLRDKSPRTGKRGVHEPRYVAACEAGAWDLALANKETNEEFVVPYRCKSWRHAGRCAHARAAEDAKRIREGFIRYGQPMAYLVLTFDPRDFQGGTDDAYRAIVDCWAIFYKRLARRWGKAPYCLLVEEHRNEFPHINALLGGHVGAEAAAGRWREIRRELNPIAQASGFGLRFWVDARAGTAALPQYIAKYCTKAEQAPLHAPRKFRRLRASRGFLGAPKPRGDKFTGRLKNDNEMQRIKLENKREAAAALCERIGRFEGVGREFFAAVDERRSEILVALARGEADGSELGISEHPDTWPEEWVTAPGGDASEPARHH